MKAWMESFEQLANALAASSEATAAAPEADVLLVAAPEANVLAASPEAAAASCRCRRRCFWPPPPLLLAAASGAAPDVLAPEAEAAAAAAPEADVMAAVPNVMAAAPEANVLAAAPEAEVLAAALEAFSRAFLPLTISLRAAITFCRSNSFRAATTPSLNSVGSGPLHGRNSLGAKGCSTKGLFKRDPGPGPCDACPGRGCCCNTLRSLVDAKGCRRFTPRRELQGGAREAALLPIWPVDPT